MLVSNVVALVGGFPTQNMSQPPVSYLPGFLPNLAVTSVGSLDLPVPLCVLVLNEGVTLHRIRITVLADAYGGTDFFYDLRPLFVDYNLRDSDSASAAFRTSGLSGSVARVWFTPQTSQFQFQILIDWGTGQSFLGPTQPTTNDGTDTNVWSFSSGIQLTQAPFETTNYPTGLPSTADGTGVLWYLAPVFPSSDASTTVDDTDVCTAATFVVAGGNTFVVDFVDPLQQAVISNPYVVDVWEVEASNISRDDLVITQTTSGSTPDTFYGTYVTVSVNQNAPCDRSGSCFIKAFISVRDSLDRSVTVPIVIVCFASPKPIIRPTPSVIISGGSWLCAMPTHTNSVQMLEAGWDPDSAVPSQRPLELPGLTALGFAFTTRVTTAVTLNAALTSGHSSQLVPYDSSFLTSSESSGALAASWANLSLVEPGLGGSSTSSMFRPQFGLVYTNHTGATVDRFPFPVTTGGITLAEFGRTFTLVAEEYTSSSSYFSPGAVEFQFEQPLGSTGPGGLSSNSSLSAAGWPSVAATSSAGGEPGYIVDSSGGVDQWIGVTNSNMHRLTLSWEVEGGFSPLTVLVTTTRNTHDVVSTSYVHNRAVTYSGASTAPQATLLQGSSPASTVNGGTSGVVDVWEATSGPIATSMSGTTTLTVGGFTWASGTVLTNLTTGVSGGTTAFVPVVLELTVTDALGTTHLYGKAYIRVYADEVPFSDTRLLNGTTTILALHATSDTSSVSDNNVVVPFANLVCGGIWATPSDVALTLTQPASSGSNTLAPGSFFVDGAGDLVFAAGAVSGEDVAVLSSTDLAGTEQTIDVTLQLVYTWSPGSVVFESLFPGITPSSVVDTASNTLYMFPDGSGNYSWPVSTLVSLPNLSGLSLTWLTPATSTVAMSAPFQLEAPPSGANPLGITFNVTLPSGPQFAAIFGYNAFPPINRGRIGGVTIYINNIRFVTGFINNVQCLLAENSSRGAVLTGNDPTSSGEVSLSAFTPAGGEPNTWLYDPAGIFYIPNDVVQSNTAGIGVAITLVIVDADAPETSSGFPGDSSTADVGLGVGFYAGDGSFHGASLTFTYAYPAGYWACSAGPINNIVAIAFAPFGGSNPTFLSPTTRRYLLRTFVSGNFPPVSLPNLSIDPRTLLTTPELFASNTMAGFNTAASGVFGYELRLVIPASVIGTEALSSSMTSSESSNSIYSVFQRFTGHTSSELGEPSEAFQCPDSVCFVNDWAPSPCLIPGACVNARRPGRNEILSTTACIPYD